MRSAKKWLRKYDKLDNVPVRHMNLMIDEINNNVIGIRAGSLFTIDYGVIGQVSSRIHFK